MMLPNPGVLDQLIRDRQKTLQTAAPRKAARGRSGLRVRLGHALIAAGVTLSGERVERPARRSAAPRGA